MAILSLLFVGMAYLLPGGKILHIQDAAEHAMQADGYSPAMEGSLKALHDGEPTEYRLKKDGKECSCQAQLKWSEEWYARGWGRGEIPATLTVKC